MFYKYFLYLFQDPNPALRLKDDIIAESAPGNRNLESNGQLRTQINHITHENGDPSDVEDDGLVGGGGLKRDISIGKSGIITTHSGANDIDWKVTY